MSSYNNHDIIRKKTLGLKEYNKTQKAKKCAKRTVAAQEAKAKTTHSAFTAVIGTSNEMSTEAVSVNRELIAVTSAPKAAFDVIAHRRALEAALYVKMETPLEMLIRCRHQLSLDAEYYTIYDGSADMALGAKSVDDNGFETISRMASPDKHDELAVEETQMSFQENVDIENTAIHLPCAPEAAQCGFISLEQLFAAAAAKEKFVTASPQKAMPSTSSYNPHWTDPAIVGYKVKQQAPKKISISTTNSSRSSFSMSTPGSSPVKTQRSYTSSLSDSDTPPWMPPTPTFLPPDLGCWARYPEPKPCNIMEWSPPQWPMSQ